MCTGMGFSDYSDFVNGLRYKWDQNANTGYNGELGLFLCLLSYDFIAIHHSLTSALEKLYKRKYTNEPVITKLYIDDFSSK